MHVANITLFKLFKFKYLNYANRAADVLSRLVLQQTPCGDGCKCRTMVFACRLFFLMTGYDDDSCYTSDRVDRTHL